MVIKVDRYEKEKFNELNQLDRIEYLLRRDHLEKHISEPSLYNDLLEGSAFLIIIMFLSVIIYILNPDNSTLYLLETVARMFGIFIGLFSVFIVAEYIIYGIKNKKAKEYLESKFFKVKNK